MIKKDSLWFVTLFSLILVLSVYYLTTPKDSPLNLENVDCSSIECILENSEASQITETDDSSIIDVLKIQYDNEVYSQIGQLQTVIADQSTTVSEKNNAYNQIKALEENLTVKKQIENVIYETYGYDSIVKILSNKVEVVIGSDMHSIKLANEVMNLVNDELGTEAYVVVEFKH